MFEEHCHILHDAWWYYFHHKNYALWQERADQFVAALVKREAARRQLEAAHRRRDWVAALQERRVAAQKQRDEAAQRQRDEAAARPQLPTFVRDVFDDEIVWDDECMLLDIYEPL